MIDLIVSYGASILLTMGFLIAFMYAIAGAMISGSIADGYKLHPCFMCLFSIGVVASLIGLGVAWSEHLNIATWLMIGTTAFLVITSFCAQHAKDLWTSSTEALTTGAKSSSSVV